MKRVFIVHGWGGRGNEAWIPWLKGELEKSGFEVYALNMPNSDEPTIEDWVGFLAKNVQSPDSDTYFVGHSIGCQTILRYLETINIPVGGAVFVAGWFNLEDLEGYKEAEIARPWINTPIDLKKVKTVLPKSTLIISDNDPFGCFEENKKKYSELGSKIIILHNAGHINEENNYWKLPEILEELK